MKATFEVTLKAAVPVITPATETEPQKVEVLKKLSGELLMSSQELFASARALFNGVSVHETDMTVDQLKEAFSAMFGMPMHFIGFYAKSKDRFGHLTNVETETLQPKGWMFFAQYPKGGTKGMIRPVDLSSFLK